LTVGYEANKQEMAATEFNGFSFIGGWLCLDFANTADGDIRTEWTERLESYAHLVAWGQQAGALNDSTAARLQEHAASHPAEAEAVLNKARQIRLTIYRIFSAAAAEQTPAAADMDAFNAALADTMAPMRIVAQSDDYVWDWSDSDALERALWPVVWSAAELLLSKQHHQVRECGGRDCSWLFLDTSRNHSRRWCSMDSCGNREKARVHYRRTKNSM
jgi:predicted RNA-binding Zn ribbon-like protein